jgi:hypothetical protein
LLAGQSRSQTRFCRCGHAKRVMAARKKVEVTNCDFKLVRYAKGKAIRVHRDLKALTGRREPIQVTGLMEWRSQIVTSREKRDDYDANADEDGLCSR